MGKFRTVADVLSEIHLKYPRVKVQRNLTRTGTALLISKDNRSQKTVDGSNIHQWQGVLLPALGNNLQEDLHPYQGDPSSRSKHASQRIKNRPGETTQIVKNNGPSRGPTHSTPGQSMTTKGTTGATKLIKLVHWNDKYQT